MAVEAGAVQRAVEQVREKFPIAGYFGEPLTGYYQVAETVLRYLPPAARILDFGSGPCEKTAILQTLGFRCTAYDDLDDPWHQRHGNRDKILAFTRDMGIDFRTGGDMHFPPGEFDMVMLLHVLEHFHDSPRDLLNDLLTSAKPDGLLFVMVPNLANIRKRVALLRGRSNLESFGRYYWMPGPWRGHVREYTRPDLVELAKYLNLDILELRGVHDMLGRLPPIVRPIYLAATALFPGWRDTWLLIARKRPGWQPIKETPPEYAPLAATKDWAPKQRIE